jgi:ribosome biogenesis GTPase
MTERHGKVIKGLGGLYEVRLFDTGERVCCRAKGILRREFDKLLIGDNVELSFTDTPDGVVISDVLPRKNALIRPPLSNLDYLFIVFAVKKPEPVIETVDKLISIAEYNSITPVIVVTKSDLNGDLADECAALYKKAGFDVFVTSSNGKTGISELKKYINKNVRCGKTAAFAGASGVGKSTLMNVLFENLSLATAEISKKIERGRHTTRHVEIFEIESGENTGFLADTPGFSMVDFARFDFLPIDALFDTFREFRQYRGECRWTDCSHVGEGDDDCALMRAVRSGEIAESRLSSYRSIYTVLKGKSLY